MIKHFFTIVSLLLLASPSALAIDWFPFPRPSPPLPDCSAGDKPGGALCVTIDYVCPTLGITVPLHVSAIYRGGKRLVMGMGVGQWHMERYRESGQRGRERQRVVVRMGKTDTVAEEVKVVYLK